MQPPCCFNRKCGCNGFMLKLVPISNLPTVADMVELNTKPDKQVFLLSFVLILGLQVMSGGRLLGYKGAQTARIRCEFNRISRNCPVLLNFRLTVLKQTEHILGAFNRKRINCRILLKSRLTSPKQAAHLTTK